MALAVRREFDWALAFQAQRCFGLAHSVLSSLYRIPMLDARFYAAMRAFGAK